MPALCTIVLPHLKKYQLAFLFKTTSTTSISQIVACPYTRNGWARALLLLVQDQRRNCRRQTRLSSILFQGNSTPGRHTRRAVFLRAVLPRYFLPLPPLQNVRIPLLWGEVYR